MSVQPLTQELFSVSDQLIATMEQEIDHLKEQRLDAMSGVQAEKNALSIRYQQVIADMISQKEALQTLSEGERQAIRDAQAKFKRTARRNRSAIRSRIKVTQRLIDTVVGALKDRQTATGAVYNRYGAIGTPAGEEHASLTQAARLNVSVDQKL